MAMVARAGGKSWRLQMNMNMTMTYGWILRILMEPMSSSGLFWKEMDDSH